MKKKTLSVIGTFIFSIAALFSLTGSYLFINSPEIPNELKKG